jgi:hypothetical protein
MGKITESVVVVLTGIIGVAALAVLVSKNANTSNVLKAGGAAFSGALSAATAPVTGGASMPGWTVNPLGNGNPFGLNG